MTLLVICITLFVTGGEVGLQMVIYFSPKIFLMAFPLRKPEPDSFVPWRCPLEGAAEEAKTQREPGVPSDGTKGKPHR